jgi:hypothetical protein
LQIELHDFGDAKVPERFAGSADGHRGRLFPGILAGTNQLNHLVDAVSHVVLPFDVSQDTNAPAAREPNIGKSGLKGPSLWRTADARGQHDEKRNGQAAAMPSGHFLDQVSMR